MNDYRHYNQYYWMNKWMYGVYIITVYCKTKANLNKQQMNLTLITFSWYVDDYLFVWFSRNFEEYIYNYNYLGHFYLGSLLQIRYFEAWWSPLALVYSLLTSIFQLEHLRGGNLLFLLLFLEIFLSFWNLHFLVE